MESAPNKATQGSVFTIRIIGHCPALSPKDLSIHFTRCYSLSTARFKLEVRVDIQANMVVHGAQILFEGECPIAAE